MSMILADVLRIWDTKANFKDDRLKDRQFGFTTDTNELVAKNDGAYSFVGATSVDDIRKSLTSVSPILYNNTTGAVSHLNDANTRHVTDANITNWNSKQAGNTHLTDISGLTPTIGDFLVYGNGAWVNRKLQDSDLPALAITDTFVVSSQAAMLALTAERGDVAIRTDESKSYILRGNNPAVLGDWSELLAPGHVTSVDGYVGAVSLSGIYAAIGTSIIAGTGLSGGGNLSASRTLSVVYGNTAGTACQGNDARLSDARTPLAHTHPQTDINNFALSALTANTGNPAVASASVLTHLQNIANAVAGRSPTGHGHVSGDITGLTQVNDGTLFTAISGYESAALSSANQSSASILNFVAGANLSISRVLSTSGSTTHTFTIGHLNDANTRHVTDTQISAWNGKSDAGHGHDGRYVKCIGDYMTGALEIDNDTRVGYPNIGMLQGSWWANLWIHGQAGQTLMGLRQKSGTTHPNRAIIFGLCNSSDAGVVVFTDDGITAYKAAENYSSKFDITAPEGTISISSTITTIVGGNNNIVVDSNGVRIYDHMTGINNNAAYIRGIYAVELIVRMDSHPKTINLEQYKGRNQWIPSYATRDNFVILSATARPVGGNSTTTNGLPFSLDSSGNVTTYAQTLQYEVVTRVFGGEGNLQLDLFIYSVNTGSSSNVKAPVPAGSGPFYTTLVRVRLIYSIIPFNEVDISTI